MDQEQRLSRGESQTGSGTAESERDTDWIRNRLSGESHRLDQEHLSRGEPHLDQEQRLSRGEPHLDQEQSLSRGEHETRNWRVKSTTRSRGAETVRRTGETDS